MFRPGFRVFESAFRALRNPAHFRPIKQHVQFREFRQVRFGDQRPQYSRFQFVSNIFRRWAARPTFYRDVGLISLGSGGFYLYNLEEVPISGRRRFNMISPQIEARIGAETVGQVQQEYEGRILPDRDPRVQRVKKVLGRLIPYATAAGLHDVNWEVHVIDSPEQNAFVAPGGKVFVFTGILPLCQDENGIAAVLGHEIAHVVAHHTA
ncbi:metalloendopeptidase [Paraconiothyrium brasiliense]|uniref:Metalloendopeptidase n=1 Tax=Paraconiothyrium brasiliense TaxID=300254 RepID=A0ABR3RLD1_9PLEO